MKIRTVSGVALILSSFAFYGGGAFVALQAVDELNRQEVQKRATETQCLRHLEQIPNAQVQNAGKLTVTVSPVTVPMEALSTASMAVMMCPTRDLVDLCLGDQCDNNRKGTVTLVLKFDPTKGR
ncbi:hypothetical protein OIU34_18125 [Pararhizobium sp. BT-229]|uniref:hypothetical protein n=1 Tax=Pararhizobium sp. BT-229 TaxID=2986923 RepID=UPI0021F73017|nr:hypothetical protein [Pararhizobium sp. BT-229]MCV9963797.1 hypothetical protein [Pararhizobium sp. BT-229]